MLEPFVEVALDSIMRSWSSMEANHVWCFSFHREVHFAQFRLDDPSFGKVLFPFFAELLAAAKGAAQACHPSNEYDASEY